MAEALPLPRPAEPNDNAEDDKETELGFFYAKKNRSAVKHALLRYFFNAWLPIVSQSKPERTPYYVDGFAGPGIYDNGDEGSPLVIYTAAVTHSLSHKFPRPAQLIFIEFKAKYAKQLLANLEMKKQQLKDEGRNTDQVEFRVIRAKFHEEMETIVEKMEKNGNVALLAFVDPFGYSGKTMPMDLMRRIMALANSGPTDVFINVMDGFASRFFNVDSRAEAIHKLLGTDDWRLRILPDGERPTSAEKIKRFMDIYIEEIGRGLKDELKLYPLMFGIRENRVGRHIFTLLFLTRSIKGLEEMKRSMWKQTQEPDGFEFSEFKQRKNTPDNFNNLTDKQRKQHWTAAIRAHVEEEFGGKEEVTGKQIEKFVLAKTIYLFNVKREFKKDMAEFIRKQATKFEDLVFQIPDTKLAETVPID